MNKLGGGEWSRTKQRVKAAAADMAKELIDLYAKRANTPGISFPKDDEWQSDFEAKFPFEETDDQLRSIQEMKEDMESRILWTDCCAETLDTERPRLRSEVRF